MKKTLLAFAIGSSFLLACNNSNESKTTEPAVTTDPSIPNITPDASTPGQVPATDNSGTMATPVMQAPAQPQQTTATAPGMNPPHGQPGHRCEIAVGAPLSSAPPAGTSTSPTITSTPTTISPTTVTAPGMNPPHGQPGHDCNVAVGAPLKK